MPLKSRVVHIGNIPMGGEYPIRLQSMTSTNTMDTIATVEQSIRMIEAGCEYVRITAPGVKEAENLRIIKKELRKRGYDTPLIADIHYQPKAALIAAQYVEKIRINPGNYVDRKKGKLNYSEAEYGVEIQKIGERLKPLLDLCKENGTALRIGSNHGSLSERIMLRYGDTATGMVESALEFVSICADLGFHELVLSMKASNVKIMVQANRLLAQRMQELGFNYPIHLGVTEAGDAEDGRMKSAAGIGPLLMDGIGDTVRVSLTEDPEFELPVARGIVEVAQSYSGTIDPKNKKYSGKETYEYNRRETNLIHLIGGSKPPVIFMDKQENIAYNPKFKPDYLYDESTKTLEAFQQNNDAPSIFPISITKEDELLENMEHLNENSVLLFNPSPETHPKELRKWIDILKEKGIKNPVVLSLNYGKMPLDDLLLKASVEYSYFLVDGQLDGIRIRSDIIPRDQLCETAFGILQATGERISKTEYIACPSCGRTLFRIQSTLKVIKERTANLKGLKIGVMGCCVNGPGEMADAHYGYVGAGKGKITLYKGKQIMKIGIKEEYAVDELIKLIKENGDWK